jgi:prepilin-type processing-associated H-X9-DG protein
MYGSGEIAANPGKGNGLFYRNSYTGLRDLLDGATTTLAVGERSHNLSFATWSARSINGWLFKTPQNQGGTGSFVPPPDQAWSMVLGSVGISPPRTPNFASAYVSDFASFHPSGVNFLFADGSVKFIKNAIAAPVFQGLATRRGKELISDDQF